MVGSHPRSTLQERDTENPDCSAKFWMVHGTMNTPVDYLCRVAHAQVRDLGLLKEDENAWEVEDWRDRIESDLR